MPHIEKLGFRLAAAVMLLCLLAPICHAQEGDTFEVISVTDLGGGRYDVKLFNLRTHYTHSETISGGIEFRFGIGDLINIFTDSSGKKSFQKANASQKGRQPENPQGTRPGPVQPTARPPAQQPATKPTTTPTTKPPGTCEAKPFDVRADVPAADSSLRYSLGFERGFAGCLEDQVNVQNIGVAALAARYKVVATILTIAVAPTVIDGVLHPPGTSPNPNPYLKGKEEAARLCEWALKVSPVMVARCKTSLPRACSAAEAAAGYGTGVAAAASEATRRFDCFPCTMATLEGRPYTPPADGGAPWQMEQIQAFLRERYGAIVPQGPGLPCWRDLAQSKGLPGSMSPTGIEREMRAAGDGAKGVVLFLKPGAGQVGHVFGVKTVGNGRNARAVFWDEQQKMDGALWFDQVQGYWLTFFRIQ